jgi:hypothetical protein
MSKVGPHLIRPHFLAIVVMWLGAIAFLGLALFGDPSWTGPLRTTKGTVPVDPYLGNFITVFFCAIGVAALLSYKTIEMDTEEIRVYRLFGRSLQSRRPISDVMQIGLFPGERWVRLAQKFQHYRVVFNDGKTLWIPCDYTGADEGIRLIESTRSAREGGN